MAAFKGAVWQQERLRITGGRGEHSPGKMPGGQTQRCCWACWGNEQRLDEAQVQRTRPRGAGAAAEGAWRRWMQRRYYQQGWWENRARAILQGELLLHQKAIKRHTAQRGGGHREADQVWQKLRGGFSESIKALRQSLAISQFRRRNPERLGMDGGAAESIGPACRLLAALANSSAVVDYID